MGKGERKKNN